MRTNLQIKVGKYVGNGADNRDISGIGFRPDLVIIKDAAIGNTIWRTKERKGDSTGFLTSSNTDLSDRIQRILNDGFQVGTAAQVNSNAITYYYIAIKGLDAQQYFRTGKYVGDGADNRNFTVGGLNFTPDLVFLQAISGAVAAIFKTSSMEGDTSVDFQGVAGLANQIQNLQANGFQLGSSTKANASAVEYFFAAFKELDGVVKVGTYTGNAAERSIDDLGFQPDIVIVKNYNTTDQSRILTSTMVDDALNSLFMGNTASDAQGIKSLDTNGFTVGTSNSVNGNGNSIFYIAIKAGNHNAPLSRLTA